MRRSRPATRKATRTSANSRAGWTNWGWEARMRVVFSVLSLLVVVAIVGLLARKQLAGAPAAPARATEAGVVVPSGTPQQQVQQYQQAVQGAMQQARPMPDDDK